MLRTLIAAAALLLAATPASAEVIARTADSFTLSFDVTLETTPGDMVLALESVGNWWDGAHTYSGDAANMSLSLDPGGCFCEALPDGKTFEHGHVVVLDDDHLLLNAPLGPLNGRATKSDLIFRWSDTIRGTTLTMIFVVEGAGLGAFADAVDGVMGGQFARLARFVEYGEV